ncbi:MAG: histidine kinase [Blautia sp.]|nr:histidine kinase [Blautia sp.]
MGRAAGKGRGWDLCRRQGSDRRSQGSKEGAEEKEKRPRIALLILFWVLLLVVPLNLVSLLLSMDAIGKYEGQVRISLLGTGDVYVNRVDYSSRKADLFLYELLREDADVERFKMAAPGTDLFSKSLYRCYRLLSERLLQEELVCAYFLRPKSAAKGAFASDGTMGEAALFFQDQMEGLKDCDNLWHLQKVFGETYLVRYAQDKSFYYGAVLGLSRLEEEIREKGQFTSLEVSFEEIETLPASGRIGSSSYSERSQLCLNLDVDRAECLRSLSIWTRVLLLMAALFVVAVPLLYTQLKKLIVGPLAVLNEGFGEIEGGNRDFRMPPSERTLEYAEAYASLNHLVEHMEELRLFGVEKELEKNKLELDNLRLQIRPHFLLNTFNLIYNLIHTPEGAAGAGELILYLSDYFRYMFRTDRDLELFDHELSLVEGYFRAAQIRYPGGVELSVDVDPELSLVRVPPLLLHNFVENVVLHALSPDRCVHIQLVGRYWPPAEWEAQGHCFVGKRSGMVEFEISDDGNGMSEEEVRQIYEEREDGGHLGIRNAMKRLRFLYGEQAGLSCQSEEGKGTLISLWFPYDLEVEE